MAAGSLARGQEQQTAPVAERHDAGAVRLQPAGPARGPTRRHAATAGPRLAPRMRGPNVAWQAEITMSATWTAGDRPAATASPIANSGPDPARAWACRRGRVRAAWGPR